MLLALRGQALPGTRSREILDKLVDEFYQKVEEELVSDLKSLNIREAFEYIESSRLE